MMSFTLNPFKFMKKQLCLLLLQFLLSVFAFGKTVSLEDALKQKLVVSTIMAQNNPTGTGNFRLSLQNLTKEPLVVTIPVGFVFKAVNFDYQDFIHLENKELPVAALATNGLFASAMCIRANRHCPPEGATFLAAGLASSALVDLTTFAFLQHLYNENAMQSALWAISDGFSLSGIDNPRLLKFVANKLKTALPDYTVSYKHRQVAGTTAATALEPLAIKATFQYTLPTDQEVKLDLVDALGNSVLSEYNLVQTMNQTQGRHRFSFTLELTGVARGTYFMKMTSTRDGKEWASKQVVF
jgi:hypothetical protein